MWQGTVSYPEGHKEEVKAGDHEKGGMVWKEDDVRTGGVSGARESLATEAESAQGAGGLGVDHDRRRRNL